MQLIGLAGGAPPSLDGICCCCTFPLLLLFAVLTTIAVRRKVSWPAVLMLALAWLPFLMLWEGVADSQPSDDWEVRDEQATVLKLAVVYSCFVAASVLWVCWNIGVHLLRGGSAPERETETPGRPPTPPGDK